MNQKSLAKKAVALLSVACFSFSAFACETDGSSSSKSTAKSFDELTEVWSCDATVKVLQDVDDYAEIKGDAKIDLTVAKGEKEAKQLILSAYQDISAYNFTVSDLTNANGDKLESEQVDVFHEKYIQVKVNYNGGDVGMYPDAIVPLENIVNVGENVVTAGDNQGVYVRFDIPNDQPAGTYTGNFQLRADGFTKTIPVSLNVLDVEVPEENHVKGVNMLGYGFQLGEQDGSQDMYDKYVEFLLDYRVNPAEISVEKDWEADHTEEYVEWYTEKAYEWMQNPKCSFVVIPTAVSSAESGSINKEVVRNYLLAFAQKSFETNYNMFEKAGAWSLDEPDGVGMSDARVQRVYTDWLTVCDEVANEIANDASITSAMKDEIVASIRKCYNVLTTGNVDRYKPLGVSAFCPGFTAYDTESSREKFADQEEKWWYGCIYPRAPYPTYQIDDIMLSPRVMGWMQADYDVVGNLFWALDYMSIGTGNYAGNNGNSVRNEDYYDNATRFPLTNGDGFLLYPGAPYGVDGPVGSLRLEAIRDGYEEYELLREMKIKYNETGAALGENAFDADSLMQSFSDLLYSGTKVKADYDSFASARKALLELCTLNDSDAQLYLTGLIDDNAGTKTFTFYASKGTTLYSDGVEITDKTELENGIAFTIPVKMDKAENSLNLTVKKGDKTWLYTTVLGGATIVKEANTLKEEDISADMGFVYTYSDEFERAGKAVKLDMLPTGEGSEQAVRISGEYISALTEQADKAFLNIVNISGTNFDVLISAKCKNSRIMVDLSDIISAGWGTNVIELNLSNLNWEKLGEIEYIQIRFGGVEGNPVRTAYIGSLTVYNK